MAINTTYKVTKGTPESLLSLNRINDQDLPLVQRLELDTVFKPFENRLDVFFYSLDGRYLSSKIDSRTYSVLQGGSRNAGQIEDITLNPEKDSIDAGYPNGDVNVLYNFVNNLLSVNNTQPKLFIESISPDRTEIRALTNDVSTKNIVRFVDTIKGRLNDNSYFEDFRLNFGRNQLLIGININRVEYSNSQAILIKLYEPLPAGISVKDTFLLEELVGDSVLYQVVTQVSQTFDQDQFNLRGPNYDVELVEENNNPTGYLSYDELFSYPVTNSYYEVYSLFNEKGAQISIDHTSFEDFIQFSSAEERLRNFYYKASLLENYRNQINSRTLYTASLVENIKGIVSNFDHYDRYLYYETGSWAWPKSSATRPFELHSTGSTKVNNWYTNIILSASNYDLSNQDRLVYSIPSFIRDDSNNASYSLFTDMIGQHFDNLWIYSKAVTDKFDADNRLEFGISKDLVRDAIENFGIKLYNNNEALENLFSAFTGETYNTGSESTVTSLIVAVEGSGSLTGSVGNEHLQPMPKSSYQKEVYKRIYHNIPLLLKSKGTERGLRALINTFGIPSDVLTIKTFGGADTSTTPFYGPNVEVTSSLGKIRVSNTDTVVTGSTLSNYTSVVNPGKDYSTDLHTVEIGFSPANNLDTFIKTHPSMSAFDIDSYIGDPGYAYSGSYSSLNTLAETVFTSGSSYAGVYNAFDFVRLIKFFDNSIFRVIKDFVPARSNIDTGIIIKPHLLNRSKIKQPEVKWSNQTSPGFTHTGTQLDYTGSFYTTNFSIDGEIDTAFISGSTGLGTIDSASYSYTETYANPSGGYQTLTRNNHDQAAYTGELSGTVVTVSNGDLTANNTFRKLEPEEFSFKYIPRNDFTSNASLIQTYESTVNMDIVSSSIESPDQSSEAPLSLELAVENIADYTGDFRLTGGPNYDNNLPDSGSVVFIFDESLPDGDTLSIDLFVDFANLNDQPDDVFISSQGASKVTLEIISGSVVVASGSLQRPSSGGSSESTTVSYKNDTGATLNPAPDSTPSALLTGSYYRVKYSSNLEALSSVNFIDASFTTIPTIRTFDPDAITLWLQEVPSTVTEFTSSFVKAMTVPLNSTTNGGMVPYLREASEVVFQYPGYSIDSYASSAVTSSVEGGAYKAIITVDDNDIFLTHITSAPYSASFRQPLPDLLDGRNLQFNFTVDFDSYWSTYLNTYNLADTPFVTASIRNSNTGVVTGSLNFQIQQGQYPNDYRRSLVYENTTGGTLSNLEFYYQVNIPKARGAGFPKVNLKNVQINYRTPQVEGISSKILSSQKLKNSYFLELQDVEVVSGSLAYFEPTTDYYNVGFIAGESELFRFNDYASISNNVDSVRRSTTRLLVDEKTYTPTQGSYRGFFLPANYTILSSSIANGVEGLNPRFFAEIQDSNYYATGWKNGRYDGSEATNLVGGFAVLGKEPALTFETFNASLFDTTSTATEIKTKFSGSETKEGDLEVYYNTYTLQGEETLTLSDVSSVETNGTAGTVNSTTYEVDISNAAIGSGTYSGSIGNLNKNDRINIDFSVLIENSIDLDISSVTVNIKEPGNTVPIVNQSYNGAEFILDSTVNKVFTFDSIPRNISDGILEFSFTNIEDDEGGSPNFTLTVNSIKKVSLLPFASSQGSIVTSTSSGRTIFYSKQLPTPSSPGGYIPVINSRIYRFSNNTVYTTNDKGIVTNIE